MGTDADPLSIEPGALPERIPCRELLVAAALFEPIGQMVANLPAATADQDAVGSRATEVLVTLQCLLDGVFICRLQTIGEGGCVLGRLGCALRKKRQHRVRRVAEQRYAPFGPPLQWFAVVERPALGLGRRNNKLAQTTVPSLELAQQIRDFSVIRPRLLSANFRPGRWRQG